MKRPIRALSAALAAICGVMLLANGCNDKQEGTAQQGTSATQPSGATPMLTIAVIPKGTTHSYWKSVQAGAEAASTELGVKIVYKGPLREDDAGGQVSLVEEFTADKISGIVLAPLNDAALLKPVQSATANKIPVIIIDSALKGEVGKDYVSYVSTDNHAGGVMAGEEMTQVLGGKGKLVLLRYAVSSASTNEREAGFLETVKKSPGFTMLVENRYAGATEGEAQTASENLLDQLKQADGIFCPNESSTLGMLKVLEQYGLAGKVHFVGFDATDREVAALKKGEIDALIAQNPVKMGYEGVKAAVNAIRGNPVEKQIDSGVKLISQKNINDPDVVKFLKGG